MPRMFVYECTRCGKKPALDDKEAKALLTAKVIQFKQVGYKGRTVRSRVVDWLCAECLLADGQFNVAEDSFLDKVALDKNLGTHSVAG